jgi:hypothetical protein
MEVGCGVRLANDRRKSAAESAPVGRPGTTAPELRRWRHPRFPEWSTSWSLPVAESESFRTISHAGQLRAALERSGELNDEGRATALTFAMGADGALVRLDDVSDNREPQPEPEGSVRL